MSKETSEKAATAAAASALSQAGDFDNSALTLLADHVREFFYREGGDVDKWKMVLAEDLKRIDEGK